MKIKGTRVIEAAAAVITLAAIGMCLQGEASYALAYREQQQLFLYDWSYIRDVIFSIGGFASLTGRFFVQFFCSRIIAVIATAFFITNISVNLWQSLKARGVRIPALAACLIPAALLTYGIIDNSLHFDALIALLFASEALENYSEKPAGNLLAGCATTAVLFLLAGPAALVFALCAFVIDLGKNPKSIALIAEAIVLSTSIWLLGIVPTFSQAVGPAFFHEVTEKISPVHLITWMSIPCALLVAYLTDRISKKITLPSIINCVLAAVSILAVVSMKSPVGDAQLKTYKFEFLTEHERWKELEKEASKHMERYVDANYYNLAKARQGALVSDLFKAAQHGPYSLIYVTGDHSAEPRLAYVLYTMGNIAAAQDVAFNGMQSYCGYKPSMVKMCAKIDMMRGAYGVADKYLSMLDKTWHYRSWSAQMRSYMSDEAIQGNSELALGRADMQREEGFVMDGSPMNDLFRILDANPSDSMAMQYGLAFLLLSKDINNTFEFIDKYYGTPALQSLDVPAQEALLFFWDYYHSTTREYALAHGLTEEQYDRYNGVSEEYCREHGVSEDVYRRFADFKEAYGKNRGSEPRAHKDTFWNYMLFSKI